MRYEITGDNLQMLNADIDMGETLVSVSGAMKYMTGNVGMTAKAKTGVWGSIKRSLSGATLFLVEYTVSSGTGRVGLSADAPGKIMGIDLSGGSWTLQKRGFLASEDTVRLDLAAQRKLSSAVFGGEGLLLQRVSGSGTFFLWGCGDLIVRDLAPGEVLKVSTSNAVAWQDTVSYDIQTVGSVRNALFSGEGVFVTVLTGPGRVVLQSMTLGDLAMAIYPFLPKDGGS